MVFLLCTQTCTKVQKRPSSDKKRKRLLQTDSLYAIISKGVQVSRVPFQMCEICRGLLLPTDGNPEEEAVGLILLYRFIISLLALYCKNFFDKKLKFELPIFSAAFLFTDQFPHLFGKVLLADSYICFQCKGRISVAENLREAF